MITQDFIDHFAKKGYYKKDVEVFLNDFFEVLGECLSKSDSITFGGRGKFFIQHKKPVRRIHPRTGEEILTKDHRKICFNAGSSLDEAVN